MLLYAFLWLIFAAVSGVGGMYCSMFASKYLLFGGRTSDWGMELLFALVFGPIIALVTYCILFLGVTKEEAFGNRLIKSTLISVLAASGIVVVISKILMLVDA
jgi:hypothetical protein